MLDPDGPRAQLERRAPSASRATRADEIIGQHFSTLLPARGRREPASPSASWRSRTAEGRFEEEGWRVRKDGTPLLGQRRHHRAARRRRASCVGFAKVTRDLTERRKAERRLLASEHRSRPLRDARRRGLEQGARARRVPLDRVARAAHAAGGRCGSTPRACSACVQRGAVSPERAAAKLENVVRADRSPRGADRHAARRLAHDRRAGWSSTLAGGRSGGLDARRGGALQRPARERAAAAITVHAAEPVVGRWDGCASSRCW